MAKKKFNFEEEAPVLKLLDKQMSASRDLIEYVMALREAYQELKDKEE